MIAAVLGSTMYLNLYSTVGLTYTSATVATALSNVTPSFNISHCTSPHLWLDITSCRRGKTKVIGTVVCIGGSLVCTFWKAGFEFKGITRILLISPYSYQLRRL